MTLEGLDTFLLIGLISLSGGEIADNDGITNNDGTILGTKVFKVDLEDFFKLEEFVLEVKCLIISFLNKWDFSSIMPSCSHPNS